MLPEGNSQNHSWQKDFGNSTALGLLSHPGNFMGTNFKKVQRVDFTFVRNNNKNKNKMKNLTKKINLYSYELLGNALWGFP